VNGITVDGTTDCAGEALAELRARPEHLVFFLAHPDGDRTVRVQDRIRLADEHVVDTGWHVELTDAGRQWVLRRATTTTGWLIEAHSHGPLGDPARFSPTDHSGLAAWVPHIRWRLPGRGYVALVLGSLTVDGLAWLPDDHTPRAVTELRTSGRIYPTTGKSVHDWNQDHP
jgi:hypothetical protein